MPRPYQVALANEFHCDKIMSVNVRYDSELDILYLAREGQEENVVEVSPGLNLEFDAQGELLGVEILNASRLMKQVIEPLHEKALAA